MSDETISRPTDPHVAHRRTLPAGTPAYFGRYEVLRILGGGTFGRVSLAFDPETERYVAIKTPKDALPPESHREFLREARIVAQLEDPNICPVYDVGVQDELPYIVMRYVGGGTLLDLLERGLPTPANALCDMHGNVSEWCENLYEQTNYRVLCGGSWSEIAHASRASYRSSFALDRVFKTFGFRLCFRPD